MTITLRALLGKILERYIGDARTIADIMEEEDRKANKLVHTLANVIETKKLHFQEMENKFNETVSSMGRVFAENDKLHQSYNEGLSKLQSTGREHFQKIFGDHEKLKFQLETQKKELELRGKELEQREARNETEKRKFLEELQQVLGVNLKQATWLSAVPWGTMAISGHVVRTISDFFLFDLDTR